MGRNHARNLIALSGVDLVAVSDPAGDPLGVADGVPVVGTLDELLEHRLDYCVVAAPTKSHDEIAAQLANNGVHMLVEKPVAMNARSGLAMVDAFDKAGLVGAVGHIERYNPALQQLRNRLENGDLGDIYQISTRRQGPFPARIADVGVVLDLASHDVDLTGFVTAKPFTAIAARTAHKSGREHEDLVAATGMLDGGIVTNHLVNWLSPQKERSTVVTGERGTFVASTLTGDLTFHENGTGDLDDWPEVAHFRGMAEGNVTRFAFAKPEPLRTEHEAFRDAVLGEPSRIVTLRDGLAAVTVCEGMLESARTGATIEIPRS